MTVLTDLLAADGVRLVRRGNRYVGLCPFHGDKKPSFAVWTYQGKERFGCWSCDAKGSIVDYLMRTRHLDYRAVLAELHGGKIPKPDPEVIRARKREQRIQAYRANIIAAYQNRNPHAVPEEIAFLRGLSNDALVAWAGRP